MRKLLAISALAIGLAFNPVTAFAEDTKAFVVKAVTELMVNGDLSAIDRYWAKDYIQHNPRVPNGSEGIKGLFSNVSPNLKFEIGMVIAEGDKVVLHSRVEGFGPKPLIVVDIYRVEDGKIIEHWDVLQEEVTETASGNPMWTPAK